MRRYDERQAADGTIDDEQPEADALEQRIAARPMDEASVTTVPDREASDGDLADQAEPVDFDDYEEERDGDL
ncbi:MAG: hypothetical protein GEU86_20540 [Actinophytocola sp.]|nr:hypothetical protein [Actinophytocola sp.]